MTPVSGTALGPDGEVLAEQDLHVPAADGLDVEIAVVVDVLHHQGDLIAVAGQHDARGALLAGPSPTAWRTARTLPCRSVRTSSA